MYGIVSCKHPELKPVITPSNSHLGRFYVFGGRKTVISNRWATDEVRLTPGIRRAVDKGQRLYRDFHYIDLANLGAGWKQLPAYPIPVNRSHAHLGDFAMEVDHADHRAYFFHGRPVLDVFDLRTNRWSQITTKMARGSGGPWPLKPGYAEFCMTIVKRKLYVFGGTLPDWSLGGNLLMALDLTSRKWTRLSGEPDKNVQPNLKVPGPRKQAMMWVDKAEERLWVMYGEADRSGAKQMREMKFAADESHVHNDCWSWGIATKEWRQERIAGNAPCPRSEAGIVHVRLRSFRRRISKLTDWALSGYQAEQDHYVRWIQLRDSNHPTYAPHRLYVLRRHIHA